jgi:hypothetical protein
MVRLASSLIEPRSTGPPTTGASLTGVTVRLALPAAVPPLSSVTV